MEELEKMNYEDAKRFSDLVCKIAIVIEKEGCTYQDAIRALDSLKKNYEKKGSDLLNSVSIQEVARFGGLLN